MDVRKLHATPMKDFAIQRMPYLRSHAITHAATTHRKLQEIFRRQAQLTNALHSLGDIWPISPVLPKLRKQYVPHLQQRASHIQDTVQPPGAICIKLCQREQVEETIQ